MIKNVFKKIRDYFTTQPLVLSYSKISLYDQCPLKYKFQYIDGRPTPPHYTLDFGSIMHNVLHDLHQKYPDLKTITPAELDGLYERLYIQFWMDNPRSKEYKEKMAAGYKDKGRDILQRYYEKQKENPEKVVDTEISFEEECVTEWKEEYADELKRKFGEGFNIQDLPQKISYYLGGKIDKIVELSNGEKKLIDYKTGGKISTSYAMVAGYANIQDPGFQLRLYDLVYQKKYQKKPKILAFYYLQVNEEVPISRTAEMMEGKLETLSVKKIKEEIDKKAYEISYSVKKNIFNPTSVLDPQKFPCRWCDYKEICPPLKEEIKSKGLKVEKVPITEEGKPPLVLSYSQISTYQQCPKKYRYQYIEKRPTRPSPDLDFGSSIHNTLRDFHQNYDTKQEPLDTLLGLYEKNWLIKGYRNKEEEERFKREGREMLKGYYEKNRLDPNKSLFLEEAFKVRIGDYEVMGRIDRIDELPDGGWEIIDYKAGKRMVDEGKLAGDLHPTDIDESHQLSLYYLACREKFKKVPQKLSLYYLRYNEKRSATRTPEQITALEKIIQKIGHNIEAERFEPKKGPLCGWCDFKEICPAFKVISDAKERLRLSYSKMSMFQRCPAQYQAVYIDKIPMKPRSFFDFGTSIHGTFEEFYKSEKEMPLDYLLKLYQENWVNAGYTSKEEEERYYQDGLKIVKDYYQHFIKGKYRPAKYLEEYFELPIGKQAIMIGFMDRVDELSDGSHILIDYKTEPRMPTQEDLDRDLQFTIYYWAAPLVLGFTFDKLYFEYLRFNKRLETKRTKENVAQLVLTVDKAAEEIRKAQETGDYPRKLNKYCVSCDLECPLKEEAVKKYGDLEV